MLASIHSCSLFGIDAFAVDVEVDVSAGNIPSYHVVGLPATAVREAGVRIRSAIDRCGLELPRKKITVNLAPAGRRKQGAAFDLPIAIGILVASGLLPASGAESTLLYGELGLDGSVRPARGSLAASLLARDMGLRRVVLPIDSAGEAAELEDIEVLAAGHLREIVAAINGECELARARPCAGGRGVRPHADMREVRGQLAARRAIEIAVAGGHNVLMTGPPGIGKTMLARRIPSILPPLERDECLEVTKVYSSLGLTCGGLVRHRPFRAPHHSVSSAALVGGGRPVRAGEVSLAHAGVLFLDELPEFSRGSINSLRQPMEDGFVTISRVQSTLTLPSRFMLVASANPCPCGWLGSTERNCACSPTAIERYRNKIGGPVHDRIDLSVFVENVRLEQLRSARPAEASADIRDRVLRARDRQSSRLRRFATRTNASMTAAAMQATCKLTGDAEETLARLARHRVLTGRGITRIIKVARTIQDLDGQSDHVSADAILEAAAYRSVDTEPVVDMRALRAVP